MLFVKCEFKSKRVCSSLYDYGGVLNTFEVGIIKDVNYVS